jgi:hypothetical protein
MKSTLVLIICMLVATVACGEPNYASDNEEILRSLPEPPGAQLIRIESQPTYDCPELTFRRKRGDVLAAHYRPPPSVTAQEIVDHYVQQLDGAWRHRREDVLFTAPLFPGEESQQRGTMPVVRFEQGTATVYVQGENINTLELDREHGAQAVPSEFSVIINARGTVRIPSCD